MDDIVIEYPIPVQFTPPGATKPITANMIVVHGITEYSISNTGISITTATGTAKAPSGFFGFRVTPSVRR